MTLSELINVLLAAVLATGDRLLQLPSFLVLSFAGIAGVLLALPILWLSRKPQRAWLRRTLLVAEAFLLLLVVAWSVDRRIAGLQQELAGLRARPRAEVAAAQPA